MADITSYFTSPSSESNDGDDIFSQIAKGHVDVPPPDDTAGGGTESSLPSSTHPLAVPSSHTSLDHLWCPSIGTASIIDWVRKSPSSHEESEISAGRTVPVIYAEKQADPIKELLIAKNRVEALTSRTFINSSQVSKDVAGLKGLIALKCFRSALNLTSEVLAQSLTSNSSSASYQLTEVEHNIWSARFSLLVRLNMASIAEFEMQPFGNFDNPDLFAEFFDSGSGAAGYSSVQKILPGCYYSLVPFSSRLLHAQMPQFLQRYNEALDRLNNLLRSTEKILTKLNQCKNEGGNNQVGKVELEQAIAVWERRHEDTLFAISNVLVALKSYREAGDVFERLLNFKPAAGVVHEDLAERKCRMAAFAGRAFLQSGCLPYAELYFNRAATLAPNATFAEFLTGLHCGYMAMAGGVFNEAASNFEQALTKAGNDNSLKVQIVTCIAVAIMYSGQLQAAIDRLESALFAEPSVYSVESLLINLSTMYELHQSNTADTKKYRLLDLVGQHCGDGFDVSCLKLGSDPVPPVAPAAASASTTSLPVTATATGPPPPQTQQPTSLAAQSFPARR